MRGALARKLGCRVVAARAARSITPKAAAPRPAALRKLRRLDFITSQVFSGTAAHFVRSGKIVGNFLRDLTGGGPFRAALQSCNEAGAFLRRDILPVIVAERGVEHAPFPVTNSHKQRFLFATAALGGIR